MALTQTQLAILEKARSIGAGGQSVALSDEACAYLVAVIARDLGYLQKFPEIPKDFPPFFRGEPLESLTLSNVKFLQLFQRLVDLDPNTDTYFACLAALHKARLKYARILETQSIPTIDQVGPRCLLHHVTMSPRALTSFLLWRKWLYDIDNRAAQETGYLFEPILASAMGGVPVSAQRSPIRRHQDPKKGRQVDCIRQKKAYEIKLRVTIAASGQGRWQEELDFPLDCRTSGFTPVLIVLDQTPNPKLTELSNAFLTHKGKVYIGDKAWEHLEAASGKTMALFLEKYVREPVQALIQEVSSNLPDIMLRMRADFLIITVGQEDLVIKRRLYTKDDSESQELPEDVDNEILGP